MKYLLTVILVIIFFCRAVVAQETGKGGEPFPEDEHAFSDEPSNQHTLIAPDQVETTRSYQSASFTIRRFDEDKWRKIVHGINYNEEPSSAPEQNPFAPWTGTLLRLVSYAIIVAILLLLIYYVGRYVSFRLKIERTKLESDDLTKPVEDIQTLDIRQLLEQAKRDRNYKLAVRLYYLELLKKLNEEGAIIWKKDKTNREYLAELFSRNFFFDDIRRLTLSYEAVWYGDHYLGADSFSILSTRFENIYSSINTKEKI